MMTVHGCDAIPNRSPWVKCQRPPMWRTWWKGGYVYYCTPHMKRRKNDSKSWEPVSLTLGNTRPSGK